jgi:hypothetical protein
LFLEEGERMGVVKKRAVAFAAAVVLLTAALGAAAVNPWPGTPSAATGVAPADAPGLNVLQPADKDTVPAAAVKTPQPGDTERAVGEWNPTGGGGGGGGSPKG